MHVITHTSCLFAQIKHRDYSKLTAWCTSAKIKHHFHEAAVYRGQKSQWRHLQKHTCTEKGRGIEGVFYTNI
uniref:Uncharacterized protein n=1 Tax=Parascaris equorum TaxID=6256 RepID=A0A914R269_PAREQ